MGQKFIIRALVVNEVLNYGDYQPLGQILFGGLAKDLIKYLAVPDTQGDPVQDKFQKDYTRTPARRFSSITRHFTKQKRKDNWEWKAPMPNLPIEIWDKIFKNQNIIDALHLSLTSKYFWNIGQKHIRHYIVSKCGIWAGENIMCVGASSRVGDYLRRLMLSDDDGYPISKMFSHRWPATFFPSNIPIGIRLRAKDRLYTTAEDLCLAFQQTKEYSQMSDGDLCQVLDVLQPGLRELYSADQLWILRDLTAQEYVRADKIALSPDDIHGPFIDGIGFGEVVVWRTILSTDPSIGVNYSRGVWAADRFDITTLERHREETKGVEWFDISEEVAEEIASIWESEYGSDWRERAKIRLPLESSRPRKTIRSTIQNLVRSKLSSRRTKRE